MTDDGWIDTLVRDLKESCPGMLLALELIPVRTLAVGILRIPTHARGQGHAPRIFRAILAAADQRGLDVVCTPTGEYGTDRDRLVRVLRSAGFKCFAGDPSGHTMRRWTPVPDERTAENGWHPCVSGMALPPNEPAVGHPWICWDCRSPLPLADTP